MAYTSSLLIPRGDNFSVPNLQYRDMQLLGNLIPTNVSNILGLPIDTSGLSSKQKKMNLNKGKINAGISGGISALSSGLTAFGEMSLFDRSPAEKAQSLSLSNINLSWKNTSTTGLLNQWNNTSFASDVTRRQLLGSKGDAAMKGIGNVLLGAALGASMGPWGALAGGVFGGIMSAFGRRKAKRQATKLAAETNAINSMAKAATLSNMTNNAMNILTDMINSTRRNMAAFGGPLYFSDGAVGYALTAEYLNNGRLSALKNYDKMTVLPNASIGNTLNPLNTGFALGGELNTLGASYNTGLTRVDAGLTHELNPYSGVPMGTDSNGVPNFVEEEESIYKDYVFSNRLTVPDIPKEHLKDKKKMSYEEKVLKAYLGMTFSEAAKKTEKSIYGEGGNINGKLLIQYTNQKDKSDTLEAILAVLAKTQETLKEEERRKELMELLNNMSPEELLALELQLAAVQQQLAEHETQEQLMMVQLPEMLDLSLLPIDGGEVASALLQQILPVEMTNPMAYGGNLFASGGYFLNTDVGSGLSYYIKQDNNGKVIITDNEGNPVSEEIQNDLLKDYPDLVNNTQNSQALLKTIYEEVKRNLDVKSSYIKVDDKTREKAINWVKDKYKDKGIAVSKLRGRAKEKFNSDVENIARQIAIDPNIKRNEVVSDGLYINDIDNTSTKDFSTKVENEYRSNLLLNSPVLSSADGKRYNITFGNDSKGNPITLDTVKSSLLTGPYYYGNNGYYDWTTYGGLDKEGNWVSYDLDTLDSIPTSQSGISNNKFDIPKVATDFYNDTLGRKGYSVEDYRKGAYTNSQNAFIEQIKKDISEGNYSSDAMRRLLWLGSVTASVNPPESGYNRYFRTDANGNLILDTEGNPLLKDDWENLYTDAALNGLYGITHAMPKYIPGTRYANILVDKVTGNPIGDNPIYLGEIEDNDPLYSRFIKDGQEGETFVGELTDDEGNKIYQRGYFLNNPDGQIVFNNGRYHYVTNDWYNTNKDNLIPISSKNRIKLAEAPVGMDFSNIGQYEFKESGSSELEGDTLSDYPLLSRFDKNGQTIFAGLGTMATALSKPNYSNANALISRSLQPYRIVSERIQEPGLPKLIDPFIQSNAIKQQTATTMGNLRNVGLNPGAIAANLQTTGYKGLAAESDALRAGILANDALMSLYYSQRMQAQLANQQALLNADQSNASSYNTMNELYARGYGLRELIELENAKSRQAGIQSLADAWYNTSRNRYTDKQLEWYLKHLGRGIR